MLHIVYEMKDLDFPGLMAIYEEGNRENGEELYPQYSADGRMRLAQQDFYEYLKHVFFRAEGVFYAVWTVQGDPVSALRIEPYRDGFLLEALETKPQCRGKGFAKALVGAVQDYLRQQGKLPVYSHIRRGNLPSEKVHSSCGFRIYKDMAVYIDGSVNSRCRTWIWE